MEAEILPEKDISPIRIAGNAVFNIFPNIRVGNAIILPPHNYAYIKTACVHRINFCYQLLCLTYEISH